MAVCWQYPSVKVASLNGAQQHGQGSTNLGICSLVFSLYTLLKLLWYQELLQDFYAPPKVLPVH